MKNTDGGMEVEILQINLSEKEYVKIGCHKINERVKNIAQFVKMQEGTIEGIKDDCLYRISIPEIYYAESVDEKTFLNLKDSFYESRKKLYEVEDILHSYHFVRISKSVVVNLMKVQSIKPALNGRFLCCMNNEEEIIISRKYVPEIKKILRGEK